MKTRMLILALALALLLVVAGVALAIDSPARPRDVLSGGASDSAGGGVTLQATLGQPVVGVVTSGGGGRTLGQGFWHGGELPEGGYDIYLPLVMRNQSQARNRCNARDKNHVCVAPGIDQGGAKVGKGSQHVLILALALLVGVALVAVTWVGPGIATLHGPVSVQAPPGGRYRLYLPLVGR
jgi:hypothetical protein